MFYYKNDLNVILHIIILEILLLLSYFYDGLVIYITLLIFMDGIITLFMLRQIYDYMESLVIIILINLMALTIVLNAFTLIYLIYLIFLIF